MPSPIVSLTTDFGLKDSYVAEMKATILGICQSAVLVDVTHEVDKFDLRMGAYALASAAPYFSKGTVHLAVVDPDVGTKRRPIIIQTERALFVGPDNGVLVPATEAQGVKRMYEITSRRLMLPHVSNTFHGRDIFAPAAAHLANGVFPEEFGHEISEVVKPSFAKATRKEDAVVGEILHVDSFGNITTNIHAKNVGSFKAGTLHVEMAQHKMDLKLLKSYAEANPQEPIALIGSHNYLEIALNQGNAAEKFQIRPGDKITLSTS